MSEAADYDVTVTPRWWVRPYVHTLCFVAFLMGATPDRSKAIGLIMRYGLRVQVRVGDSMYTWNGTTTDTATGITKRRL